MNRLFSLPVARATARERGLAPLTLACTAALVLLGTLHSSADAWGAEAFSGFAGFWFFLLTLLLGAGLLSEEVESGHAQLVLLRPLTRAQWVGGRLAGAALVLCAAGAAGWASSMVMALLRGGSGELAGRLLVLPLALLPALGWLATLVAIGAAARGWTNAGILLAARLGWFFAHLALPMALPKLGLQPLLDAINGYFGPQDALRIARQVQYGERFEPRPPSGTCSGSSPPGWPRCGSSTCASWRGGGHEPARDARPPLPPHRRSGCALAPGPLARALVRAAEGGLAPTQLLAVCATAA